ncbi:SNF2-related protein [Bifidobacterium rousetti]|uniref:SNF2-related protein n=1 Tax=Bifidobacterium rousetti TaxID=2045439 RepID=UPI00168AB724|nr:SNF2-related protein [Bifidobacterium rousetti]
MSGLTQFIDNRKQSLGAILRQVASNPAYKDLSIVTGYWDMIGTSMLIDLIKDYRSVRILIGAEPFSRRNLKLKNLYEDFPDADIAEDLKGLGELPEEEVARYRETARILAVMVREGRLQVRICRRPFIHAKEYVFGAYDSVGAVGIIGSSNFTGRGLSDVATGGNAELNYLEDKEGIVLFQPHAEGQQYGHLSWFDMMWNLPEVKEWTGDFQEILSSSPVGNKTYGPYDVYIRALMRLFPDELSPELDDGNATDDADVLYAYQRRNAGILVNKLRTMGTAILADSVGLGKTVTAGAVINRFRKEGKRNIAILPPAKLKGQWRMDLQNFFKLDESCYSLVSQQDIPAIQRLGEAYRRSYPADLIVVDEAHNLRNERSERFKAILNLIGQNPNAKVLLLTATPINNGFKDLVSELELGLGGRRQSGIMVSYQDPSEAVSGVRNKDFFEFLQWLDTRKKNVESKGGKFDWNVYRQPLSQGISHFIVRSTRQGVQEESKLLSDGGPSMIFPENTFDTVDYAFPAQAAETAKAIIGGHADVFEGIDPLKVDGAELADETQRLRHPLDIIAQESERFHSDGDNSPSLVRDVFSLVVLLGFPIYRSQLYAWDYRNMTVEDMGLLPFADDDERARLRSAMTIHNILQTIWLKRLESSLQALRLSVERYRHRLDVFSTWLDRGYVIGSSALSMLDDDDEEQSRLTFWDDAIGDPGQNLDDRSIDYDKANEAVFDVEGLHRDVKRDLDITDVILKILSTCIDDGLDAKLGSFAREFVKALHDGRFGGKVLVFSAYADTIDYLQSHLPALLKKDVPDFGGKSAFLTAASSDLDNVVGRFSPVSKKHTLSDSEYELDYLFSTDVLSEGQNLQDAAILINYDLHWNPVRMVQRNGRVNRLGSCFDKVLIGNMAPTEDLEYYLGLLSRLQGKIDTIKNSIGTDQGVLTSADENPIEYIQDLYSGDDAKIQDVIASVDADNDMLSWRNSHVYALREFLHHASQEDVNRIEKMPKDKWNYLPSDSHLRRSVVMMCEQFGGIGNGMNYRFVRVEPGTMPVADPISNEEALDLLATGPEDNASRLDDAQLDRKRIGKSALSMVGMHKASDATTGYQPKKNEIEPLTFLQRQLGMRSLLQALGPVRNLVQAKQRYETLMGRMRKEIRKRDSSQPLEFSEQLIADWHAFLDDISQDKGDDGGKWRTVMASMSPDL